MLVMTQDVLSFLNVQYVIMEIIDRTWRYSEEFRNEYFEEKQDAYEAIASRGSMNRRYAVVDTCVLFRVEAQAEYPQPPEL